MGYTLDYFVADLTCPRCRAVTRADDIEIATHIRAEPQLAELRVGDPVGALDPVGGSYQLVNPVLDQGHLSIVEDWGCGAGCRYWPNWVEITIDRGVVTSIEDVAMNAQLLARTNYLSHEATLAAREVTEASCVEALGRPRWPAPPTPESRELARIARLTEEDAAALLAVDVDRLSDEERAFLHDVRARLQAGAPIADGDIDRVHVIVQHLP